MKTVFLFVLLVNLIVLGVVCKKSDEEDDADVEKSIAVEIMSLKFPNLTQSLEHGNLSSIADTHFDSTLPTRLFIHGFQSKGEMKKQLIRAYFQDGKHNINLIAINWEKAASSIDYFVVKRRVNTIGIFTAKLIDSLVQHKIIKLKDLSVIGFSLGAHAAGIAGKNVKSGKIVKITGLDPAHPLYSMSRPNERLDTTDAIYVETLHTSKLGFSRILGHVSFYPNGGLSQPQCKFDILGYCSHQHAYKYFAKSINTPIYGYLCNSLEDAKTGNNCSKEHTALLGGEPGSFHQTNGVYYLPLTYH